MNDEVYTETYKGYTITVDYDDEAMNPDETGFEEGSIAFLTAIHREFYIPFPKDVSKKTLHLNYWKLPLYAYIHSGVSLSLDNTRYPFNDCWDACQVGYVFVKRLKLKTPTEEKAREVAEEYLGAWRQYLDGNVFRISIEEVEPSFPGVASLFPQEDAEQYWNYYASSMDEVIQDARDMVDSYTEIQALDAETTLDRPMAEHEAEFNLSLQKDIMKPEAVTVRIYIPNKDRKIGAMAKALAVEVDGFAAVKGTTKDFLAENGYYDFVFKTEEKGDVFQFCVKEYIKHPISALVI